jgi:hypothetical protein
MAQKIIKVRLFTWFENVESPIDPSEEVRTERISHFGEDVDINDETSVARGEELDAFFSDEDAAAIRDGTYDGPQAALLETFGQHQAATQGVVTPALGEGPQTSTLSTDELADYIVENKLSVNETVALATEGDADSINKVYDAEVAAAQTKGVDPRKGVTDRLDSMLTTATSED